MNNFEGKSLSDLKKLLKDLKLYKDLKSKLGNRGKKIFSSIINNKNIYKIEYFEALSKDDALEQGLIAYKKVFGETPKKEEIDFVSKKSLEGGIRIYKDGNLVDFSFARIGEQLKG